MPGAIPLIRGYKALIIMNVGDYPSPSNRLKSRVLKTEEILKRQTEFLK